MGEGRIGPRLLHGCSVLAGGRRRYKQRSADIVQFKVSLGPVGHISTCHANI